MRRFAAVLIGISCLPAAWAQKPAIGNRMKAVLSGSPLSFESNAGQNQPRVKFSARGGGYSLDLESTGARFQFDGRMTGGSDRAVSMSLAGASGKPKVSGEEMLPGTVSYTRTTDPGTWFKDIPTYARVHYTSVYPGVDMAYYGSGNRVEYDFIVAPGADARTIRMNIAGADRIGLDNSGDVVLAVGKADFRLLKPVAYQTASDGKREAVEAAYRLEPAADGGQTVDFYLGTYDHNRAVVIDPIATLPALAFSEYTSGTYLSGLAVDSTGNAYITGYNTGSGNGFYVTKYNTSGAVVYTHVIGTGSLYPLRIAVDGSSNADVTGYTGNTGVTLPTTANAYQTGITAGNTVFFAQLNPAGSTVSYATYLSGTDTYGSAGQALGVDSTGKVYLSGYTYSGTFPVTSGVYQNTFPGSPGSNYTGFVAEINPAAATGPASLVYSTYLGSANSQIFALAVDASANVYVTGNATSNAYPVTTGAFRYTGYDSASGGVYVTKLNAGGATLGYSAYLGYGSGYSIAADGAGDAYVTGDVSYADFPTTPGAYQTTYAGGFVVELAPSGSTEIYSTFLGGPSSLVGGTAVNPTSIAIPAGCASACNAYVAGWTRTTDFPAINPFDATPAGTSSGFVVELAASGSSAVFSSYFNGIQVGVYEGFPNGSALYGFTPAIAVDASENMVLAGNTAGNDFPVTTGTGFSPNTYIARVIPSSSPFLVPSVNYPNQAPAVVNFPYDQVIGVSTSVNGQSQTVNLRNMSATEATITTVASPPTIFSETDSCGGVIAAGAYCALTLNFTPGQPGPRTGTITVTSNASNSPVTITVNGTGEDSPYIQTSVSSLTFGNQTVNTTSAAQLLTLTNIGDQTAALNVYFATGTDYKLQTTCPSELAPGSSCLVSVAFTPTQPGPRPDTIYITGGGPTQTVTVAGTGVVTGLPGSVTPSVSSLNFGTESVGVTTATQQVVIVNTGGAPVSFQSIVTSGDFAVNSTNCPINSGSGLNPQATCYVNVTFTPTTAGTRTGALTFSDSAAGSPQAVTLTGIGLAATPSVEFYPGTTVVFANQPVGYPTGSTTVYLENAGAGAVTIDRVLATGDFQITSTNCPTTTLPGTVNDGFNNSYSYCSVNVDFSPTATGLRTGTLSFVDSATGSPQVVNLQGNGIAATGTLQLLETQLVFASQTLGTTSPVQYVELYNPGDTPISVTGYNTGGSTDFAVSNYNCGGVPFTLNPASACYVEITFTPTSASNPRTATLTVTSSAGNQTTALTGTGVAASLSLGITPSSPMNSGTIVLGSYSGSNGSINGGTGDLVSIRNTGTSVITFTANPAVSGTNAGDFIINNPTSCGSNATSLQPGASCNLWIQFTPLATGARTATLSFADNVPGSPQTLTLNGTGASTPPTYGLTDFLVSFNQQTQGTTSPNNTYIRFLNNSGVTVTMGNVQLTGDFLIPSGYNQCNGTVVPTGNSCYIYLQFAPTAAGNRTGTVTFVNNSNTTLISAPLAGYAAAEVDTSIIDPTALDFGTDQVVGTTSNSLELQITNTGNAPLKVGAANGTNIGGAPSSEFALSSDGCSNQTVQPGGVCSVYIVFTPNAAGTRSGKLNYPITYNDSTTTTLSASLSGLAVAETDVALVSPSVAAFVDQTVGITTPYNVTVYLQNSGNRPFNVGGLTGVNTIVGTSLTGEFSTSSTQGGYDGCSHQTVQVANSCYLNLRFTPSAPGARTGSVTFPVTFADNTTASPTLTLTGNGVVSALTLQITPPNLTFNVQIQGTTSTQQLIQVKNIGNAPVQFNPDSISGPFTLGPNGDSCSNNANLAVGSICYIYVVFTPTATGTQTGTLTIADDATGGPHTVPLTGTGISTAQQIALSTTAVMFGNQPAGSNSAPELIYVTNQGNTTVNGLSPVLGGTNPTAFAMTNNCPSSLSAQSVCTISVSLTPGSGVTGPQAATVTISYSDPGSPQVVNLSGTAVTPAPMVTIHPSPMTFTTQNVGTTSAVQRFSVTNTGSANLIISTVVSSNPTEFAIVSDGCSGATLTPNQTCSTGVTFSPILGGTRITNISINDNATGSPQVLAVSGTGYGIPQATPSPASIAFGSAKIGATTAASTVTVTNGGTDTLVFASAKITGGNTGDFALEAGGTCAATLAPGASCTILVAFTPKVSGALGASLTFTDNANNAAGSIQSVSLTGTGVAVPAAVVTGGPLSFGNQNINTSSSAQSVTLQNNGTGPLTIASITIGAPGANPGDFAQTSNCGLSLPNGSTCTISVIFTPSAAGARAATLIITDNAANVAGTQQTVALSGTGVGVPTGTTATPSSLTFPSQNVGTTSAAQTVTLSNSGTGPLSIASIAITQSSTDFAISSNPCGTSLAAGANCQISITFTPAALGARSGTLVITDNAGNVSGSTQSIALSGLGVGVPQATTSTASLTFTSQNVNSASVPQGVTLTNGGTGPLTISSVSIGGTNPTDFTISSGTCSGTLAAGSNCSVNVVFNPTAAGARAATLLISDNAGNTAATQTVTLSGTGVGVPVAAVTPTTMTFPNHVTGAESPVQYVTIRNTGTAALSITGIAGLTGTPFPATTNCGTLPASVPAGGSCAIGIAFSPTAIGTFTATLTITDNTGNVAGSTQTVSISGTSVPIGGLAPNLTFPAQTVGTTSAAKVVTLSNSGTDPLTITAISGIGGAAFGGADPGDFATVPPTGNACTTTTPLASGKTCSISITFKPTATGTRTATLIVTDNSQGAAGTQETVTLTGTGQ